MRRTTIARLALLALTVSAAGVARPARAGTAYFLTDLGTLGGATSLGQAVNASGQVAGFSYTASGAEHAFLSGPGGGPLKDLGTLPGFVASVGSGVNASGQVAGYSYTASDEYHAFLSGPGGGPLQDLGTLPIAPDSIGRAVNASGQVAGYSGIRIGEVNHAFLSGPGGGPLKDLGTLGGSLSQGNAVNASGQVAGVSSIAGDAADHAFLSGAGGGALKDLGTLGGTNSAGEAVNASGQVAGFSDATGGQHAFLSGPGGGPLKDLGTLPGFPDSFATAVNDAGQVVGYNMLRGVGGPRHAFLYSGGQMLDLSSLIAPGSGFSELNAATGISDTGYITGWALASDGSQHAFLLTPVPEPCGWVLLGTGAVALLGYTARQRVRTRA
jgi:probable HAF family extracellular repeat protein